MKGLFEDAGINGVETFKILEISQSCEICKKYKKTPPTPIVGFPIAKVFNESVAMDLKEWKHGSQKTWFLHLVDHATRFSAAAVIYSKRKEVIIDNVFKKWINIFGKPKTILVDNGREFANNVFVDFCENLNFTIRTVAQSLWSNGLVEHHNEK